MMVGLMMRVCALECLGENEDTQKDPRSEKKILDFLFCLFSSRARPKNRVFCNFFFLWVLFALTFGCQPIFVALF